MAVQEQNFEIYSRADKEVSLSELTRMGEAVRRATNVQSYNSVSTGFGTTFADPEQDTFWIKVTAKDSSTPPKYTWSQVMPDGVGGFTVLAEAMSGDPTTLPAFEVNGQLISSFPSYGQGRFAQDGWVYFHAGEGAVSSGGGGSTVIVQDSSGSPSYAGITTVQVVAANGLVLTNPSAPVARLDVSLADVSTTGVINTTAQSLAGQKRFTTGAGGSFTSCPVAVGQGAAGNTATNVLFDYCALNGSPTGGQAIDYGTVGYSSAVGASPGTYIASTYQNFSGSGDPHHSAQFNVNNVGGGTSAPHGLLFASDGISTVQANYATQSNSGTFVGKWGTDPVGNVISGGLVTTIGAGVTQTSNQAIVAAGTTQGTATAITANTAIVTTTGAGQGVVLPATAGARVAVMNNDSTNSISVYPQSGAKISGNVTNAAITVSIGHGVLLVWFSSTQWLQVALN